MTRGHDVAVPLDDGDAAALRRMIGLTDEILADMRPLDCVCTFTLLLARHEFALHLARACDTTHKIKSLSREPAHEDARINDR